MPQLITESVVVVTPIRASFKNWCPLFSWEKTETHSFSAVAARSESVDAEWTEGTVSKDKMIQMSFCFCVFSSTGWSFQNQLPNS